MESDDSEQIDFFSDLNYSELKDISISSQRKTNNLNIVDGYIFLRKIRNLEMI